MSASVRRLFVALGVFGLQWLVLGRLRLWGAYPDAVLLFLAWYALREGRRHGTLTGFVLGTLMDVAYGTWGIHMFVKTLVGFGIGSFAVEERGALHIRPLQAVLGSLAVALLHNGLLVVLLALQTEVTSGFLIYGLWLGSAAYTAAVGYLTSLFMQ